MSSVLPDFSFELPLWEQGHTIIGIDEVGRGAFAGPVGIGGVVFDSQLSSSKKQTLLSLGINDSKKISPNKRDYLYEKIKELALCYKVSFIPVSTINEIGIGRATFLGMKAVVDALFPAIKNPYLLIDAFTIPNVSLPQKGIIRGDSVSISIAAASILAKVERDKLMQELGIQFSNYGWDKNKGYGTQSHRQAILSHGICDHHRTDFVASYI